LAQAAEADGGGFEEFLGFVEVRDFKAGEGVD
jgi:hypothetical protein